MEDRETASLIGSDKVEGTDVHDGQKVGIERGMIDKVSGKVSTPCSASAACSASGTTTTRCRGKR